MNRIYKALLNYSIPVLAVFAALTAAVWGRQQRARAEEYARIADEYIGVCISSCARCGQELEQAVSDMGVSLEKLRVTASREGQVLALEDLVRESARASSLLSRLPQSQPGSAQLASFLTRAGDYARTLSKKLLSGADLPEDDARQLSSILSSCGQLSQRLSSMLAEGGMPNGTEDMDYYDEPEESADEPSEPEYPTLIYDGPFSESTEKAEPKGVTGEYASESEALRRARELFGAGAELKGVTEGRLPAYDIVCGEAELELTVRGLHLLWYMRQPEGDAEGLPDDEEYARLVGAAKGLLARAGYDGMEPSFAQYHGGTALISFVWVKDGVLVYNDLIKVWIDRATCEPCGLDARNYLFSHCERELPAPAITAEEAGKSVSGSLEIAALPRLALIPVSPQTEALCWEFRGKCGETEYYVYINAENGREERIFKIVSGDGGREAV